MPRSNSLQHWLTRQLCDHYRNKFIEKSSRLKETQSLKLKNLLLLTHDAPANNKYDLSPKDDWRIFSEKVPVTDYSNYQPWIDRSHLNEPGSLSQSPIQRYQPTSGSTSAIKWIPYSSQFLAEINAALMAWMGELYQSHPGIREGFHYWSISCIPTSLRDQVDGNVNDDLKVLPWWERWIVGRFMAVPESVALAESSDDTVFATLAWLVTRRDLTLLSVWSPTFALTLIELLKTHRDELIEVLENGDWLSRANSLRFTPCPRDLKSATLLRRSSNPSDPQFLSELWPHLSLISCWDTSSSSTWATELHRALPFAQLEGKGLWATEGVVTIPFAEKYPLAINSHYYEFMDIDSNSIIPSWMLEKGMNVSPILSTGSGFLRYRLNDRLLVTDFYNQTPCFEFLGRIDGTDMAGEKISSETAMKIINLFRREYGLKPLCLLAVPGDIQSGDNQYHKGRYVLLCYTTNEDKASTIYSEGLENRLSEHFHYKLARELKQLESASVLVTDKAHEIYHFRCRELDMVDGDIKIEPLVFWNTRLHPKLETNNIYKTKRLANVI